MITPIFRLLILIVTCLFSVQVMSDSDIPQIDASHAELLNITVQEQSLTAPLLNGFICIVLIVLAWIISFNTEARIRDTKFKKRMHKWWHTCFCLTIFSCLFIFFAYPATYIFNLNQPTDEWLLFPALAFAGYWLLGKRLTKHL